MRVLLEEYYSLDGDLLCRYENGVRVHGSGSLDVYYTFFSATYLGDEQGQLTYLSLRDTYRLLPDADIERQKALVAEHGPLAFVHDTRYQEVVL